MCWVPAVGVLLKDFSLYLNEFRRKQRKTPNGYVDKRGWGVNPAPPVYPFRGQNHSAACMASILRFKSCSYLSFRDIFSQVSLLKSTRYNCHFVCETNNEKILVWHSQNFLIPCITVEEYFIISTTFIFILYFLYFVVDEGVCVDVDIYLLL